MRSMPIWKWPSPVLASVACVAVLVGLSGWERYARAEGKVGKPAAEGKASSARNAPVSRRPGKTSGASTSGKSASSRKATSTASNAPVGGFMPLPSGSRERAMSYWARDGGPVDMRNPWRKLEADGFHDPTSDAIKTLQGPVEAMRTLPRAGTGNFVDWVAALKSGAITPRAEADKPGQMKLLNSEIVLRNTRTMPTVTFSHSVHSEWLACSNCHNDLFKEKAGATVIKMTDIFKGQSCGVCHGTVAFPPDQCFRCHNGPRRQTED